MESFAPLTRFDVVRGALRVQLWVSVVQLGQSLLTAFYTMSMLSSGPSFRFNSSPLIYGPGLYIVPIFLLALFPGLLAANSLGHTGRETVSSWEQARPLIGRCVGLWLFVQSGSGILFTVGSTLYNTLPGLGSIPFSLGSLIQNWPLMGEAFVFLLGFFLAFGPAIRDNFRK